MWATTTSSRDNWERLVAAVIKREQIRQLCHQDSITTVDSDFSDRTLSLRSVSSASSRQPPFTGNSTVEERKGRRETITQKLFSTLLLRRNKPKEFGLVGISDVLTVDEEDYLGVKSFSLRELQRATDSFSRKNLLGGEFFKVYKGRLADGSLVAVEVFIGIRFSMKEVLEILTTLAHRNVISLRGFCYTEEESLLVCRNMANGSVASCLRERPEQPPLKWAVRSRIAVDVARGISYLHHECTSDIIHGDVTAAKVLLDEDFHAVVSDFSSAKFVDSDYVVIGDDDVVRGTFGHLAPEYLVADKWSSETDVFGYGVFLLELITGQRSIEFDRCTEYGTLVSWLVNWVKWVLKETRFIGEIVDPRLNGEFEEEEVWKMVQIALNCTLRHPELRPTMSEIVMKLEDGHGLTETREEMLSSNIFNIDKFQRYL